MTGKQASQEALELIRGGKIRNHLLGNAAGEHGGEAELIESQRFRDFLPTKNGCTVFDLVGCDNLA